MTDLHIIQELKSGNYTSAMKGLYKHYGVVRAFVLKNSGSKQDAEDVFQEALIILYRKVKAPEFQLTSSLATFITGISRYYWLGELRKRGKSINMNLDLPETESEDFSALLENESRFAVAEQALLTIGEKCRDLLRLFYFEKLNFTAIALRIGLSNEKVAKNQKYRCLEKARESYLKLNAKTEKA